MAFNRSKTKIEDKNEFEIEGNKIMDTITLAFIELQKAFDYLKENTYELQSVPSKKYLNIRRELYSRLNSFPSLFKKLGEYIAQMQSLLKNMEKYPSTLDYQHATKLSLDLTKKKILYIIDDSKDFENILKKKDNTVNNFEATIQDVGFERNYDETFLLQNQQQNIMQEKTVADFRASLLEVREIENLDKVLVERQKSLKEIHKVTGQISEMTGEMKTQVFKQGDLLSKRYKLYFIDNVEDNIVDVKVNVIEADRNVKEAENITKGTTKRICILVSIVVLIILIVLACLIAFVWT